MYCLHFYNPAKIASISSSATGFFRFFAFLVGTGTVADSGSTPDGGPVASLIVGADVSSMSTSGFEFT